MAIAKRRLLATAVGMLRIEKLILELRARLKSEFRVLSYHRIVDLDKVYDRANVSASPEEFRRQVAHFKRDFDPISFSDLIQILDGRVTCPRKALLISFDDGFSDNYVHAFPILKEAGLSAAFFVSTSHIGSNELFWFDDVAFCLRNTAAKGWTLSDGTSWSLPGANGGALLKTILSHLKTLPDGQRKKEVANIRQQSEIPDAIRPDPINKPMSWEQLREMSASGMEIFSHSHTHPILATLATNEEVETEIRKSREVIEREVGVECPVFAFPVGRANTYDERALSALDRNRYRLACINENGVNRYAGVRHFELNRINIDNAAGGAAFRSIIVAPELFAY